jgi:flagellar basal body-associated protein FliL
MKKGIKLLVMSVHILMAALMFLSSVTGQQSNAQQSQPPPTDFFALECDEIKNKVNSLLNAKGPVQLNLISIKNMTFLMHIYDDKCPASAPE